MNYIKYCLPLLLYCINLNSQTPNDQNDHALYITLDIHIFLEGAYEPSTEKMHTRLNEEGYLPGQAPVTFFGTPTEAGQPYKAKPWNYFGSEGLELDSNLPDNDGFAGYPLELTDYVLLSLRSDKNFESEVCRIAAALMKYGQLVYFEGQNCCELDTLQSYFVVVEHRNHLPVMSYEIVNFQGATLSYDFRIQDSYRNLFGRGQKEIAPGIYVMYAGNGDQSKTTSSAVDINVRDYSFWSQKSGLNSSYYIADYDLNGDVNVNDQRLALVNNGVLTDVELRD